MAKQRLRRAGMENRVSVHGDDQRGLDLAIGGIEGGPLPRFA